MSLSRSMSWFIRLLLVAVMLTIAGVSAYFLTLTWSVASPLYFRVVEERTPPPGQQGRALLVEVRNASDSSVVILGGHLTSEPTSPREGLNWLSPAFLTEQVTPPAYAPGSVPSPRAVPAGGKRYYLASLDPGLRTTFERGRFEVTYTYLTSSQRRVQRLCSKVAPHLPKSIADYLPSIREFSDHSTLDVSVLRPSS